MKKWNMIIDIAKCHDCNNCFLACKDEFVENAYPPYSEAQPAHAHRWINIMRRERGQYPMVDVGYLPIPCMHCDEAPCMNNLKDGEVYKRPDGIVIIDPVKSRDRKDIVEACPYGAIWWNDEKKIPQKCTFCAHLLDDGWRESRCVQACPTGAMKMVLAEPSEMEDLKKSENLEIYRPEYQTEPRVFYKNIYRYISCFISGNVVLSDTDECAEGATITLEDSSNVKLSSATANNYGDFKIDGLKENSGIYNLAIEYKGYKKMNQRIDLKTSVNTGTVFLKK